MNIQPSSTVSHIQPEIQNISPTTSITHLTAEVKAQNNLTIAGSTASTSARLNATKNKKNKQREPIALPAPDLNELLKHFKLGHTSSLTFKSAEEKIKLQTALYDVALGTAKKISEEQIYYHLEHKSLLHAIISAFDTGNKRAIDAAKTIVSDHWLPPEELNWLDDKLLKLDSLKWANQEATDNGARNTLLDQLILKTAAHAPHEQVAKTSYSIEERIQILLDLIKDTSFNRYSSAEKAVRNGSAIGLRKLLAGAPDNFSRSTLLFEAASKHNPDMIKEIIKRADPALDLNHVLYMLAAENDVAGVSAILKAKQKNGEPANLIVGPAIKFAAKRGNIEVVEALMESAPEDVDISPAVKAAHDQDDHEMVQFLMQYRPQLTLQQALKNANTSEELFDAAQSGDTHKISNILKGKLPPGLDLNRAYHTAAWSGHADVIKLIQSAKVDGKPAELCAMPGILFATKNSHVAALKELLAQSKNKLDLQYGFELAVKQKNIDIVNLYLDSAKLDLSQGLQIAASEKNIPALKAIIQRLTNDGSIYPALEMAIHNKDRELTSLLLNGTPKNFDHYHTFLLRQAARLNDPDLITQLLQDAPPEFDRSDALTFPSRYGHIEAMKAILHGATPTNPDRNLSMQFAAEEGNVEAIKLLRQDASPDLDLRSPRRIAIAKGHVKAVQELLGKRDNDDIVDDMVAAIQTKQDNVFDLLLQHSSNDLNLQVVINKAISNDRIDIAKRLLERASTHPNYSEQFKTFGYEPAMSGNSAALELILSYAPPSFDPTDLLKLAIASGKPEAANVLLKHNTEGTKVDVADLILLSAEHGHTKTLPALLEAAPKSFEPKDALVTSLVHNQPAVTQFMLEWFESKSEKVDYVLAINIAVQTGSEELITMLASRKDCSEEVRAFALGLLIEGQLTTTFKAILEHAAEHERADALNFSVTRGRLESFKNLIEFVPKKENRQHTLDTIMNSPLTAGSKSTFVRALRKYQDDLDLQQARKIANSTGDRMLFNALSPKLKFK